MNIFLVFIIFFLSLLILYLVLNYKMTHAINHIFRNHYQDQLKSDMQEFYRELENYGAIFENRIQSFKSLIDIQKKNTLDWKELLSKVNTTKKAKEILDSIQNTMQPEEANEIKEANETKEANEIKKTNEIKEAASHKKNIQFDYRTKPFENPQNDSQDSFAEDIILEMPDKTDEQGFLDKAQFSKADKASSKTQRIENIENQEKKEELISPYNSRVTKILGKLGSSISGSFQPAHSASSPEKEKKQEKLLDNDEVIQLIQEMRDHHKKEIALQVLLKSGFSISDISEMAEIPYSELETMNNIYQRFS